LYEFCRVGPFNAPYFWRIAFDTIRRARFLVTFTGFTVIGFAPFPAPLAGIVTAFDLSTPTAPPTSGIGAFHTDVGIYIRIVGALLVNTSFAVVALTKML
jgi:hypothetical protein